MGPSRRASLRPVPAELLVFAVCVHRRLARGLGLGPPVCPRLGLVVRPRLAAAGSLDMVAGHGLVAVGFGAALVWGGLLSGWV